MYHYTGLLISPVREGEVILENVVPAASPLLPGIPHIEPRPPARPQQGGAVQGVVPGFDNNNIKL